MSFVRKYYRSAKNAWNNYSEVEVWVREATSNDPWGPSSSLMARIARDAESPANYHMIFTTLWKRLTDYQYLKHVLKSLVLIDYLLRHCHERFVSDVRLRSDVIRRLKNYKYFEDGKDIGAEVRHKAQAVLALLENRELLEKERIRARETEGKIQGYSHEYDAAFDRVDPFGISGNNEPDQLALEYERERREAMRAEAAEEEHKEEEVEHEEGGEKPKKKKGKKLKKKRSKKVERREDHDDEEEEEEVVVEEHNESNNPPVYASQEDDFLSSMANAKPIYFEPDFVTGGMNSSAASSAAFGWLVPAVTEPVTNDELALFDAVPQNNNNNAKVSRAQTQDNGALFDFGAAPAPQPWEAEHKEKPKAVDPWEVAKEISILDDLHTSVEDVRIKQSLQAAKERQKTGPKLKDLQKNVREEEANLNPFDALVQGAPSQPSASGYGSMALVPAGQFYDPNSAYNSQALVPVNPFVGGYGYPSYPPMYPDPFGYNNMPRPY